MKILGRWATVGFAILAIVLGFVAAVVAVAVAVKLGFVMPGTRMRGSNGTVLAVVSLVLYPVVIITLMLASRRSGSSVLAYMGLDIPRRQDIAITVAGLAVWIALFDALQVALGWDLVPPWQLETYRSARVDGSLIWLWLVLVVAAPIAEELLFRGFVFRGFVHTQRDAVPGILLISLVWSSLHLQYDWYVMATIFVFGMLLGLVRWSTGSTTLTIILHMLSNLESLIETEFVLG